MNLSSGLVPRTKSDKAGGGGEEPRAERTGVDVPAMTGMKVFSATKAREREFLGETITDWIVAHPELLVVGKVVMQSSDSEYHCLSITVLYRKR